VVILKIRIRLIGTKGPSIRTKPRLKMPIRRTPMVIITPTPKQISQAGK